MNTVVDDVCRNDQHECRIETVEKGYDSPGREQAPAPKISIPIVCSDYSPPHSHDAVCPYLLLCSTLAKAFCPSARFFSATLLFAYPAADASIA